MRENFYNQRKFFYLAWLHLHGYNRIYIRFVEYVIYDWFYTMIISGREAPWARYLIET